VNWYVAFAFCVYDGGRLPTEAEWNYVAAFGDAQRPYPWSESTSDIEIDTDHASFFDYPMLPQDLPSLVGGHELGRGGFFRRTGEGHDDLAGNLYEWTLDQWLDSPPQSCEPDCMATWQDGNDDRVIRGGAYISPYGELYSGARTFAPASNVDYFIGFRCARDINRLPPH
jgi:formylglycine-generating enzyme required for sulfatase activity